jgi:hypothetical protein
MSSKKRLAEMAEYMEACALIARNGADIHNGSKELREHADMVTAIASYLSSAVETPPHHKWPGEPPHCPSCACGAPETRADLGPAVQAARLRTDKELGDLGKAFDFRDKLAGAVVPVLMGGGAAPGVTFPAMRYMCTKHGLIPHQDCEQCRAEQVKASAPTTCDTKCFGWPRCECGRRMP